jgi:hypothetical protein
MMPLLRGDKPHHSTVERSSLHTAGNHFHDQTPSAQPVDSQISIEVSNPRLEKVKMKQQQSTRLLAMMKAMMTKDEDDESAPHHQEKSHSLTSVLLFPSSFPSSLSSS